MLPPEQWTPGVPRRSSEVEEVAARLKVQERTVRDWIVRGELQAYKIGKEWRIRRDHFDEAMEARLVTGGLAQAGGLWDPDAA
jgi:excisionase family DNA binding protein